MVSLVSRIRAPACAALAIVFIAGCASTSRQAPVVERAPAAPKSGTRPAPAPKAAIADSDARAEFYVVKRGDTLYTIALDHGLDYKELAEWNNLDNPNVIRIGQQLRLRGPGSTGVVTAPLRTAPAVEAKPVTGSTFPAPTVASGEAVKSQPKAVKIPYSDQALAQLSAQPSVRPVPPDVARVEPRPVEKPSASDDDDERIEWAWPAGGKVLTAFNESASLKGIGIAGKPGQPVMASAPGKVLYSGDGIRGYGKLVIIKHNRAFLSVYAHNSVILVKEGQNVSKGQKIAEIGNSDAAETKLHFEIRRFGKPVDPIKFLPERPA